MMSKILTFPQGFLWGAATAAHQVEGGNIYNDWWWFEQKGGCENHEVSGEATDHYHRFEEDFDIAQSLHHNTHRFSIEWSRIEPQEGSFNPKEIQHYRQVIRSLKKRKFKVILTLFHFSVPWWFLKKGGFENPQSPTIFNRFVEYVVTHLNEEVDFWITVNEPSAFSFNNYLHGIFPAGKKNLFSFLKVNRNLLESHRRAYLTLHKHLSNIKVGIAHDIPYYRPLNKNSKLDKLLLKFVNWIGNDLFLDPIKHHLDFIGLQYYFHTKIQFKLGGSFLKIANEYSVINHVDELYPRNDLGWEIYPQGIYHVLVGLKKYKLPIVITENGVADAKDNLRKDFISNHLVWIQRAIEEGVDVKGYIYWSLMDNFEWITGRKARFGLVEIDYENNLKRKIRPSARYFAQICQENRLKIEG